MKRWSKLKKRIEDLLIKGSEIHLTKYRMKSQRGSTDLPRITVKHNKEIIFDYPKDFSHLHPKTYKEAEESVNNPMGNSETGFYPYWFPDFTVMIHTYIDTNPKNLNELTDMWGFYSILRSLDRRFKSNVN